MSSRPRSTSDDDGLLPCGARPDDLLIQVAEHRSDPGSGPGRGPGSGPGSDPGGDRPDRHQAHCPHCQAALAEYARVWSAVDDLAAEPVTPPPGLLDDVLRGVRARTGPAGWAHLPDQGHDLWVAARVVVAIAGHTARATRGVRMALGQLGQLGTDLHPASPITSPTTSPATSISVGARGRSVALDIVLAADYGTDLPELAARLRRRISAAVHDATGHHPVSIGITIDDVLPPRHP